MTLPNSDAQSANFQPHQPQNISPNHSMPVKLSIPPHVVGRAAPSPFAAESGNSIEHEHALDFATHSWDLATGGLKTLTAKRELPIRPERRISDVVPDILATSRSYMFALVIIVCVLLMLVGGGIVLLVMLQP